jgi:hypothetical protein
MTQLATPQGVTESADSVPQSPGPLTTVECVGIDGTLHVVALTSANGDIWHCVPGQPWGDVDSQMQQPRPAEVATLACGEVCGALQVLARLQDGSLYLATGVSGDGWQGWTQVA